MTSKTGRILVKKGWTIISQRIAVSLLSLFVIGQKGYAQGRVEEDLRKKNEEKNSIARRQEAADRARTESTNKTEKLNETKSLNKAEPLNKEIALNKPEIRAADQAKLREASETLKKSGTKDVVDGSRKPSETGNPASGDTTQAKGKTPGKVK